MSRCFSYPPPGYAPSRASNDALIESIKFQNGRVKSKEPKKSKEQRKEDKRRERKEKRKEKKAKTKQNPDKSRIVQSQVSEKIKDEFLSKGIKDEPEQQLERSSVTEEHGKPVCLRAPSTSSDSTEHSNKRKMQSSPVDVSRGHGKIIRIRLPLKKQKQSDASGREQQICSTSGRANVPSQNEDVIDNRNDREQICSTSRPIETFDARKTPNPSMTDAVMTPMQRAELQYTNLMDSFVGTQRQDASLDADDLDWLLKSKNLESCAEKKQISGNDSMSSCSSSSGLWPRAQYLQEVDLYALPFTVPF